MLHPLAILSVVSLRPQPFEPSAPAVCVGRGSLDWAVSSHAALAGRGYTLASLGGVVLQLFDEAWIFIAVNQKNEI